MRKTLSLLFFLYSFASTAQSCFQIVYPAINDPGGGIYHVYADSTINDQSGSEYYICSGAHLTVNASAGNLYLMENNSKLTINDHDGDVVFAKGNCIIIDYSTEAIVVNKEASSTFSKPNMPLAGIVFPCTAMLFDYSLVGGGTPCLQTFGLIEQDKKDLLIYPNPIESGGILFFKERINAIQLYNLGGQIMFESTHVENNNLQLPQLIPGLYLAKVSLKTGKIVQIKMDIR